MYNNFINNIRLNLQLLIWYYWFLLHFVDYYSRALCENINCNQVEALTTVWKPAPAEHLLVKYVKETKTSTHPSVTKFLNILLSPEFNKPIITRLIEDSAKDPTTGFEESIAKDDS